MDFVTSAITAHKIPIGPWLNTGMNALKDGSGLFFDDVSDGLSFLIDHTVNLVSALPPLVFLRAGGGPGLRAPAILAHGGVRGDRAHVHSSTRATGTRPS